LAGIEVEGELLVAGGAILLYLSHCIASSLAQAMGLAPGKMLSSNEQGLDILEENRSGGLQSGEEDGCDFVFDVAALRPA